MNSIKKPYFCPSILSIHAKYFRLYPGGISGTIGSNYWNYFTSIYGLGCGEGLSLFSIPKDSLEKKGFYHGFKIEKRLCAEGLFNQPPQIRKIGRLPAGSDTRRGFENRVALGK